MAWQYVCVKRIKMLAIGEMVVTFLTSFLLVHGLKECKLQLLGSSFVTEQLASFELFGFNGSYDWHGNKARVLKGKLG